MNLIRALSFDLKKVFALNASFLSIKKIHIRNFVKDLDVLNNFCFESILSCELIIRLFFAIYSTIKYTAYCDGNSL